MRAIFQDAYGSVDKLELREIDPPAAGEGEVLVRVHAAGVNRADWHLMTGLPYVARVALGLRAPKARVRGLDVAGRVEAVGEGVTRFQPGDEVFGIGRGTFAELAVARVDKLAPKPASLSFEAAAAVPIAATTALQAVRDKGEVQPGQKALVIGAGGGVGSFAVQLAKALGAHVTGVCSTGKVELVRSLGADDVVDYTKDDFTTMEPRYDLILDIAGNRSLAHLRRALTPDGTLVLIGGEDGGTWSGGMGRNVQALVQSRFGRQQLRGMIAAERAEDLRVLSDFLESGQVTPAIDRTYPLDDTAEAIRALERGQARGKLVITV